MLIDSLVAIVADQNGGKSNQIRTIFEEGELYGEYSGYPQTNNIKRHYIVGSDTQLFLRLASWHEKGENYEDAKADIESGFRYPERRYKVLVPLQITKTDALEDGESVFRRLLTDFNCRRAFAIWLSPNREGTRVFQLTPTMARFLSKNRHASALAIDAAALHPSADPPANSINARLICDLLFRS
jgi:hypothetical protein